MPVRPEQLNVRQLPQTGQAETSRYTRFDQSVAYLASLRDSGDIIEISELGPRTMRYGLMKIKTDVSLSNGVRITSPSRMQLPGLYGLLPNNPKWFNEQNKELTKYFGIDPQVISKDHTIILNHLGHEFKVKPGGLGYGVEDISFSQNKREVKRHPNVVDNRTMSITEILGHNFTAFIDGVPQPDPPDPFSEKGRYADFTLGAQLALFGLMIYPDPEIHQKGLIVGGALDGENLGILLPGHIIRQYIKGWYTVPIEPDCLYVVDTSMSENFDMVYEWIEYNKIFNDIRPVGVLFEPSK